MIAGDDDEGVVHVHGILVTASLGLAELHKRIRGLEELPVRQHHVWTGFVHQHTAMQILPEGLERWLILICTINLQGSLLPEQGHGICSLAQSGGTIEHQKLAAISWLQLQLEPASKLVGPATAVECAATIITAAHARGPRLR